MSKRPVDARIAGARSRLAANLGALQHRVTEARNLISPRTYLRSPWLKLGLGIAVGYLIGRRRSPRRLTGTVAEAPPKQHGLLHAAVRASVTSLAGALIERAVARMIAPPPPVDELPQEPDESTTTDT